MRKEFSELKTTQSSAAGGSLSYITKQEQESIDNVKILVVSESSPSGDSQTIEDLVRIGVGAEEEDDGGTDRSAGLLSLARGSTQHPQHQGLMRMSGELATAEQQQHQHAESAASVGVITLASAPQAVVVSTGHGLATSVINHSGSLSSNSNSQSSSGGHLGIPYEHPLTAATTAMLNINGNAEDTSGFAVFYDYYGHMKNGGNIADTATAIKTEPRTINADIWSPVPVTAVGNTVHSKLSNGEMFVSSDSLGKSASFVTEGGEIPLHATSVIVRRGGDPGGVGDGGKESPALLTHSTLKLITSSNSEPHHHSVTPADIVPPLPRDLVTVKQEAIRNSSNANGQSPHHNGGGGQPTSVLIEDPHNPHHHQQQHQQFYASSPQLFASLSSNGTNGTPTIVTNGTAVSNGNGYEPYIPTVVVVSAPSPSSHHHHSTSTTSTPGGIYAVSPSSEYYYGDGYVPTTGRVLSPYDGPTASFGNLDGRYRTTSVVAPTYKTVAPVTVDLPSPDSGIEAGSITPRDHANIQPGFEYNETCQIGIVNDVSGANSNSGRTTPAAPKSTRPWHEFGRQSETDKIQIPKLFSNYGFRYYLESPISTSQRREDDRITYINKGQFYGISLEYIPDTEKPLKSQTVKSVVMLVFREEKSPEDETKAWQFWHSRQHSVKQRILDADTKNSVGLVGCIEEVAHNAIAVYWNPMESSAKINVAVQCLSTDFSSQKGVKGLPLHLQIDTYDEFRDPNCPIVHRAYCQIKVFCDKGAERKTRDEERRAQKRKLTATGRKKMDEMYHTSCERSEFYSMSDLAKPPVLFSPAEDLDKLNQMELHSFYSTHSEEHSTSSSTAEMHQPPGGGRHTGGGGGGDQSPRSCGSASGAATPTPLSSSSSSTTSHHPSYTNPAPPPPPPQQPTHAVLKFHNTFPPDSPPAPAHHHSHHPLQHQNNSSNHPFHHLQQQHPPPPPLPSYIRAPPHHHTTTPPPTPLHHSHIAPIPPPPAHSLSLPPPSPQLLQHPPPPPSAPLTLGSRQHDSPPPPQPPRPASSPAQSQKSSNINGGSGGGGDSIKNGLTTNKDTTVVVLDTNGVTNDSVFGPTACKRLRLMPPVNERLMLYVRQEPEEAFTALHLVPPSTLGLLSALEEKFKISMGSVKNLYRRNVKGIVAKVDDDMLKHYCQEDTFNLEVKASENDDALDITLAEYLPDLHPGSQQQQQHQQPPPLIQVPSSGTS